jgi:hypothetical protein
VVLQSAFFLFEHPQLAVVGQPVDGVEVPLPVFVPVVPVPVFVPIPVVVPLFPVLLPVFVEDVPVEVLVLFPVGVLSGVITDSQPIIRTRIIDSRASFFIG